MRYLKGICSIILPVLALSISGCTKPSESTAIDGIKVTKSMNKMENNKTEINSNSNDQKSSVETVLEGFPRHVFWEFENEENHLYIDAEVAVPDSNTVIYTGKAEMEAWTEEKKLEVTKKLLEEGLISEKYQVDVYREEESFPPLVSLCYTDDILASQEKSGTISEKSDEDNKARKKLFCSIFEKVGFQIKLEPNVFPGETWDQNSYKVTQLWQNLPIARGFPTTGINDIVHTGGRLDFAEEKIIFFDIVNLLNIKEKKICNTLADPDTIKQSLQKAVDTYEVMFSKGIKGVRMELEYLTKVQNNQIELLPVWRVYFDEEGYYQFLEENPDERENLSMMYLCINAVDGSIVYGI